jgi:hypothetical protein
MPQLIPSQHVRAFALAVSYTVLLPLSPSARAAPITSAKITEFVADNRDGIVDEDGNQSDWLEIWNASGVAGDLNGWHLTDDPGNLTKWTLPAIPITSGGYVVVFASGKDRSDPAGEPHTNFRIQSDAGGYLALVKPDGVTIATVFENYPKQFADTAYGLGFGTATPLTFLVAGAQAKWHVPTGPVVGWTETEFDDAAWSAGATGIGYDINWTETELNTSYVHLFGAGGDVEDMMRSKNPSIYIRIPFEVPQPDGIGELKLRMKWDDGFVAHLNGTEFERQGAPVSPAWNSSATNGNRDETDAQTFFEYPVDQGGLVQGTNVLAIQGLNSSAFSSDVLFVPELTGIFQDIENLVSGFFVEPTPGTENGVRIEGIAADTKFEPNRGFYDSPIEVAITTSTPEATIRYTTDASTPTLSNGSTYTAPITINRTTTLRAAAFKTGFDSTNVETHTYVFLDDVVAQSGSAPPGWPNNSINGQVFNYGMDPNIVNHANPAIGGDKQVKDALTEIPTISIVTDQANLTGRGTGIYTNPQSDGIEWERESHIELLFPPGYVDPDGNPTGFASPAGLRIRGGFSRKPENPKHSFRIFFRNEYGNGRLNYRLFGDEGADEFDKFDLRTPQNYSWSLGGDSRNSFMRDIWSRDTQLAMGRPATRGRFYHLYLNGIYWGLYQSDERAEAAFGETYFGGDQSDYDVVKTRGALTDGTFDAWRRLWEKWSAGFTSNAAYFNVLGRNPDGTPNPAFEKLVDPGNLIDYMIILYYSGDSDGPPNNYFSLYNRENPDGWKFFEHDSEHSLDTGRNNMVNSMASGSALGEFHPRLLHQGLMANPEYKLLFADRVAEHCFNDGLLIDEMSIARIDTRAQEIDSAIIANSARWGDSWFPPQTALTRTDWLSAVQAVRRFFNNRASTLIGQLRSVGWYPNIDPPGFSQHGGSIAQGAGIVLSTNATGVYYTLDGSDPRAPGGAVAAGSIRLPFPSEAPSPQDFLTTGQEWKYLDDGSDAGTTWRTVDFDDAAWASGPSELGYGDSDEATEVGWIEIEPETGGLQRNATTYFRTTVEIANPGSFSWFVVKLKYDDGAAVYVNGAEAVRTDNLPAGAAFNTYSKRPTPNERKHHEFIIPTTLFVPGENTIAVELHQESSGSSDISFDLILRGEIDTSAGANLTKPVLISEPSLLKARAYDIATGSWSPLNTAFFTVDTVPADATNVVISELHYHPAEPATPEEIAVSRDRDNYEFVELLNIGPRSIDLSDVEFSDGIVFVFPPNTVLGAGARAIVVRNEAAFTARYGELPDGVVIGQYSGRLSNDGEQVILTSSSTGDLHNFTYNDQAPWPTLPDGDGHSLVLVEPASGPDHAEPTSWLPHAKIGGAPGEDDNTIAPGSYLAWKNANGISNDGGDEDGDLIMNFAEYAMGTLPRSPDSGVLPRPMTVRVGVDDFLAITFQKSLLATDVTFEIQTSTDLSNWITGDAFTMVSEIPNGDGETAAAIWRGTAPITSSKIQYLRVRISLAQ